MTKTVTIETLRQNFAKLQQERLGPRFSQSSARDFIIRDWAANTNIDNCGEDPILVGKMVRAAVIFVTALDHGLAAAMLLKLAQHT